MSSSGRHDDQDGLRGLHRESSRSEPSVQAGCSDGQPLCPQGRADQRELLESAGCELVYLPPYSPDFSPIEEAFSKIKGFLRRAEARSREALVEAMGKALDAVTAKTQEASSSTADTVLRVNCFDRRCRRSGSYPLSHFLASTRLNLGCLRSPRRVENSLGNPNSFVMGSPERVVTMDWCTW